MLQLAHPEVAQPKLWALRCKSAIVPFSSLALNQSPERTPELCDDYNKIKITTTCKYRHVYGDDVYLNLASVRFHLVGRCSIYS